jgi:hypothetical protein
MIYISSSRLREPGKHHKIELHHLTTIQVVVDAQYMIKNVQGNELHEGNISRKYRQICQVQQTYINWVDASSRERITLEKKHLHKLL